MGISCKEIIIEGFLSIVRNQLYLASYLLEAAAIVVVVVIAPHVLELLLSIVSIQRLWVVEPVVHVVVIIIHAIVIPIVPSTTIV